MLSLFFKKKDYKDVADKYLDKITNDMEKLKVKRIAGMTAAQEFDMKLNNAGDRAALREDPQTIAGKLPHDVIPVQDFSDEFHQRDTPRDRTLSRSLYVHSHCTKIPVLSTDFNDFHTASSAITSESREMKTNDDSYDATVSSISRRGRTLSRKIMAESIENMHKEIEELRSRITIVANADDTKDLCEIIDIMQGDISGLKSMMTHIVAETRKNEAEFADATDKMQVQITSLNNSLALMITTASEKEWHYMLCGPVKPKVEPKMRVTFEDTKKNNQSILGGCENSCSNFSYPTTYEDFGNYFSFMSCASKFN